MVNVAKSVRVVRPRRAGRYVVEDDRSTVRRQPFGQSRCRERLPGNRLFVRQEVGTADVMWRQNAVLQQSHRVALQSMARGETTSGEGRRYDARRRRKRATKSRKI